MEAFAMARAYEARSYDVVTPAKPWYRNPSQNPSPNNHTHNPTQQPASSSSNPTPPVNPKPTTQPPLLPTPSSNFPVRHLPSAEIRDRRAKGLCFRCDEKWGPSHRCRSKVLLLLGTDEDTAESDSEELQPEDVAGDISSLHALSSRLLNRSLRVSGMYGEQCFQILIDSGSTHNFINPVLVEKLGLSLTPCTRFRVATGCGSSLICQYCCLAVPLVVQGITFSVDLHMLAIKGPDVVLGFPWLELLGKVTHDYSALTMEFYWNNQHVVLQGETVPVSHSVSLLQFQALLHSDDVAGIFTLTSHTKEPPEPNSNILDLCSDIPDAARDVLQRFSSIFRAPTGLPPHRSIDHRIHLVEGTNPVNVRPYRYPQFQKA
jgi:hypothetical protein